LLAQLPVALPPAREFTSEANHQPINPMNEDRQMIIHFNNGSKMDVTFPQQIKNSTAAVLESMKKALESDKLVIIPWSSIRQLEVTPMPPAVPFGSIKGARISQ
jgi:hypothetical protein